MSGVESDPQVHHTQRVYHIRSKLCEQLESQYQMGVSVAPSVGRGLPWKVPARDHYTLDKAMSTFASLPRSIKNAVPRFWNHECKDKALCVR